MGGPTVKVKPLYGGGPEGPLSVLLTIDDLGILLDCGWSEQLPLAEMNALKEVVPQVDLVLLSQPSTAHVGALPHAVTRLGLKAQIFATAPIQNMGQLFLYDLLLALKGCSEVDAMSFEDIDAAFELVTKLKHGQHTALQVKGWELVLTAHASGHMLGGTVWNILVAGQSIVYAPAFNHHRERHLAATSIGKTIKRPALLISRSPSPTASAVPTSQRNSKMLDCVMAALRRDGTVLIPTDTAGRVLELILVLADHWDKNKLPYPLMLLNSMAFNTLEFAKASLEFMDDGLFNTYVNTLHNPFHLRMLKLLHRTDDLTGLRARPRVVLASMASLEMGYARHLLAELAADPKNCLLLVQPPAPGTLASTVLEGARSRAAPGEAWEVAVELRRRVRLEGAELEERQRLLLLQQQQQQQEEALLRPQDEGGGEAGAEVASAVGVGAASQRPMRESSVSLQRMASSRSHRSFTPMHRAASAPLPAATGTATAETLSAGDGTGAAADMAAALGAKLAQEVDAADADLEPDPDVLVDGFTVPQGAAAPMFPFEAEEEPGPDWDDYGAKVDLQAWLRPGEDAELEEGVDSGSEGQGDEEEADALEEDQLTKVVAEQRRLQLRLQVEAFDFQGLSDLRSFAHIVNSICPRHIVVVHSASAEAARQLASAVEASAGDSQLHLPESGEEVEVVLEPALPPLAMGRELLQRLKLRTEDGLSLGWLQGVVHSEGLAEPQLVPSQQLEEGAAEGGIFIGNVRISRLFAALSEASITAEFHGSGLVCSDGVVVRVEGEAGRVEVEGPLCPQYFKVRDVVYNQYHVC